MCDRISEPTDRISSRAKRVIIDFHLPLLAGGAYGYSTVLFIAQ